MNVEQPRRGSNPGLIWVGVVAWVVFVLIAATVLSIIFWGWLSNGESGSTTVRNLGLVVAAIIGLPLAIWRSVVAERQAEAAQRQADTAHRQHETAQRGLLNERYQKGAAMLGSEKLTVRLGGIYAIARLASEHPGDYHTQIISLLCAFVRNPTAEAGEASEPIGGSSTPTAEYNRGWDDGGNDRPLRVREDVQTVMTAICKRNEVQINIEDKGEYRLNLFGADLTGADLYCAKLFGARLMTAKLYRADLFGVDLTGAYLMAANLAEARLVATDLSRANLADADLTGADLKTAKLKRAHLVGTNLEGANLDGADLTGADMRGCKGLTQKQIDDAEANLDNTPDLTDVGDANTGEPLVWRGAAPHG